ncbi:MAG: sodium:proton antiporter [Verrucomicrobiales bacterium]|nr:sodium:proton antiporter [Verrucomicrobiales bacterium]
MDERLLFYTAVLLLGIGAQWLAWRIKMPSILLLLATGFVAGQFYDQSAVVEQQTLFAIVSLAVGIIMLEGGLTLRFSELKEAGGTVLRLIGLGSMVTWGLTTLAAHYLAGFSVSVSLLVAAVLVVTGPTVIVPLLNSVRPRRTVNSVLKWEGIVIDPVGAILAVLVFGVAFGHGHGHSGVEGVVLGLGKTMLVGIGLGYGAAVGLSFVLSRHWVPDFLQSVVVLTVGLSLFTVSNLFQHESGLLTVTILGIGLANQDRAKIRHVVEFKETLRTILISCLFIVLGARIGIDDIQLVWKEALLLLLALIVVVRPLSVFISTFGSKIPREEKIFLALMAPRGIVAAAVSSVFALELAESGGVFAEEASRIVPITYTIIVGTVAFYGLLAAPLARKLGLALKNPQGILFVGVRDWAISAAKLIQEKDFRVLMIDSNYEATRRARMAGVAAVNANVLSDYASEEIDMVGIGSVLATTPNDQVNTLACINLGHTLGISNVYQLKPADSEGSERKSSSSEFHGRYFGDREVTSSEIEALARGGAIMKCTTLNEEFTIEDFRAHYGENSLILFRISSSGELLVVGKKSGSFTAGEQLIALVKESEVSSDSEG